MRPQMPDLHCKFPALPRKTACFGRGPWVLILAFITFAKSIPMNFHFIPQPNGMGLLSRLQMRTQASQGTELAAMEGRAVGPRLCLPHQACGKADRGRVSEGDKIPWVR